MRKEISFLSNLQREIVFLYYFQKLKTIDIAKKLNLPRSKIRWHLVDARNQLKEGFKTNKDLSTKNENDFLWYKISGTCGGLNADMTFFYSKSISRKITYSVFHKAKNIKEIARNLSIPTAFVEDEIKHLAENGFLRKLPGGKYQSNVLIIEKFRDDVENSERALDRAEQIQSLYKQGLFNANPVEAISAINKLYQNVMELVNDETLDKIHKIRQEMRYEYKADKKGLLKTSAEINAEIRELSNEAIEMVKTLEQNKDKMGMPEMEEAMTLFDKTLLEIQNRYEKAKIPTHLRDGMLIGMLENELKTMEQLYDDVQQNVAIRLAEESRVAEMKADFVSFVDSALNKMEELLNKGADEGVVRAVFEKIEGFNERLQAGQVSDEEYAGFVTDIQKEIDDAYDNAKLPQEPETDIISSVSEAKTGEVSETVVEAQESVNLSENEEVFNTEKTEETQRPQRTKNVKEKKSQEVVKKPQEKAKPKSKAQIQREQVALVKELTERIKNATSLTEIEQIQQDIISNQDNIKSGNIYLLNMELGMKKSSIERGQTQQAEPSKEQTPQVQKETSSEQENNQLQETTATEKEIEALETQIEELQDNIDEWKYELKTEDLDSYEKREYKDNIKNAEKEIEALEEKITELEGRLEGGRTQYHKQGAESNNVNFTIDKGELTQQAKETVEAIKKLIPDKLIKNESWNDKDQWTMELEGGRTIILDATADKITINGDTSKVYGVTETWENLAKATLLNNLIDDNFTAYHEGYHIIENLFLSDNLIQKLNKVLKITNKTELQQGEERANKFAYYVIQQDKSQANPLAKNIFKRLSDGITRMYRALLGQKTADDLFKKIYEKDLKTFRQKQKELKKEYERGYERLKEIAKIKDVKIRNDLSSLPVINFGIQAVNYFRNKLLNKSISISDTKEKMTLSSRTLKEVDFLLRMNGLHAKAVPILSEIIKNSKFMLTEPNTKQYRKSMVKGYNEHFSVANIDGDDYLVVLSAETRLDRDGQILYNYDFEPLATIKAIVPSTNLTLNRSQVMPALSNIQNFRVRKICQELFLNHVKNKFPNETNLINQLQDDLNVTLISLNNGEIINKINRTYIPNQQNKISRSQQELQNLSPNDPDYARKSNSANARMKAAQEKINVYQDEIDRLNEDSLSIAQGHGRYKVQFHSDDSGEVPRSSRRFVVDKEEYKAAKETALNSLERLVRQRDEFKRRLLEMTDDKSKISAIRRRSAEFSLALIEDELDRIGMSGSEEMESGTAKDKQERRENRSLKETLDDKVNGVMNLAVRDSVRDFIEMATPDGRESTVIGVEEAQARARDIDSELAKMMKYLGLNGYSLAEGINYMRQQSAGHFNKFTEIQSKYRDETDADKKARYKTQLKIHLDDGVSDYLSYLNLLSNAARAMAYSQHELKGELELVEFSNKHEADIAERQKKINDLMKNLDANHDAVVDAVEDFLNLIEKAKSELEQKARKFGFYEQMKALKITGMLSSPWTHARNIINNAANVMIVENMTNILTSILMTNSIGVLGDTGLARGTKRGIDNVLGRNTGDADNPALGSKFGINVEYDLSETGKIGRAIHWATNLNNKLLTKEDAFSYGQATAIAHNMIARVFAQDKAIREAMFGKGVAIRDAYNRLLETPTDTMKDYIENAGLNYTYNYAPEGIIGDLSKLVTDLKQNLEQGDADSRFFAYVATVLVPFERVPANVLNKGLDLTPVGIYRFNHKLRENTAKRLGFEKRVEEVRKSAEEIIQRAEAQTQKALEQKTKRPNETTNDTYNKRLQAENETREKQNQRIKNAELIAMQQNKLLSVDTYRLGTKAMVGNALLTTLLLVLKGAISGSGPRDKETREQLEATGWRMYSIKIGDKWISYQDFAGVNMILGLVGEFWDGMEYKKLDEEELIHKFGHVLFSFGDMIMDESFLNGAFNFLNWVRTDQKKALNRFMATEMSFFNPVAWNGTKALSDWFGSNEIKIPEGLGQNLINEYRAALKWSQMYENIPTRRNVFGDVIERTGWKTDPLGAAGMMLGMRSGYVAVKDEQLANILTNMLSIGERLPTSNGRLKVWVKGEQVDIGDLDGKVLEQFLIYRGERYKELLKQYEDALVTNINKVQEGDERYREVVKRMVTEIHRLSNEYGRALIQRDLNK